MNKYQEALEFLTKAFNSDCGNCEECLVNKLCHTYEAIQTLHKIVDKATPKKPSFLNYGGYKIGNWHCPNCDSIIILDSRKPKQPKRCEECGQKLDWSDINE